MKNNTNKKSPKSKTSSDSASNEGTEHADLGESHDQVEQRLLEARPDELIMFTSLMLDVVKDGLFIGGPCDSEHIGAWVIIEHAERIAGMYRETFLK